MPSVEPGFFLMSMIVLILGVSIHEYAHAKMAFAAGDPTPRFYGRVTLNPLAHLDPMGTVMMVLSASLGFGIGWGKPVLVNPAKMRNPRWDHFASVAAGPVSNLLQAVVYAIVFRLLFKMSAYPEQGTSLLLFLQIGVITNISLCLFNLIPLGPLDGHWMLGTFMPEPMRVRWYMWNRQVGSFLFLAIILIGQFQPQLSLIDHFLSPAAMRMFTFLVGV